MTIGSTAFSVAAGATTGHLATDRVIYKATTGALYYDADGTGATVSIQIAQPTAGRILTASADVFIF